MSRSRLLALVLFVALVLLSPLARGDTLVLKNGNRFEGKVVRETATHVYFKIRGMGEQPFRKSDILKIEKGKSLFDEYADRSRELTPDDAEGHYQLGAWCKENSLRKEAKREFKAAVEADPDHSGARAELGFVRYEFEWITKKRHQEILARIAEREGGIIEALTLGDPYQDEGASFSIGTPKGDWKTEKQPGLSVTFTGPELGKAPVTIHLERIPEESTLAESLDEFVKGWFESLDEEFEDWEKVGSPAAAELAGKKAKLLASKYARDDIAPDTLVMERRDLVAAVPEGYFRLSMECREGYADRLKPFFDKVAGSVKIVGPETQPAAGGAAGDETLTRGYSLTLPDDTYEERAGLPIQGGDNMLRLPPNTCVVVSKPTAAVLLVNEGRKGAGGIDATSLQTLRDSLNSFMNIVNFTQVTDGERTLEVDGVEALAGNLNILGGRMGSGYWCVFTKGDRYYRLVFLNFVNRMGERYAKPDFQKFLDGFKFK